MPEGPQVGLCLIYPNIPLAQDWYRLRTLVMCILHILIGYSFIVSPQMEWNFDTDEMIFKQNLGFLTKYPVLNSAFGDQFGYILMFTACLMLVPVLTANLKLREFMLPGIVVSMYQLVCYLTNGITFIFELCQLTSSGLTIFTYSINFSIILTIHIVLLLNCVSFYDALWPEVRLVEQEDADD